MNFRRKCSFAGYGMFSDIKTGISNTLVRHWDFCMIGMTLSTLLGREVLGATIRNAVKSKMRASMHDPAQVTVRHRRSMQIGPYC